MSRIYQPSTSNDIKEFAALGITSLEDFYSFSFESCIFCRGELVEDNVDAKRNSFEKVVYRYSLCRTCGWWLAYHRIEDEYYYESAGSLDEAISHDTVRCLFGTIRELPADELVDLSTVELRGYLAARFETRFLISPTQFEKLAADCYKNAGYETEWVGRTGDNGIDVIMLRKSDDELCILQAKRFSGKVDVKPVRELVGTMVDEGVTTGIFVTTSDYTGGAKKFATRLERRGFSIKLTGADDLLNLLRVPVMKEDASFGSHPHLAKYMRYPKKLPVIMECYNNWGDLSHIRLLKSGISEPLPFLDTCENYTVPASKRAAFSKFLRK